jgi:hypothetical protein
MPINKTTKIESFEITPDFDPDLFTLKIKIENDMIRFQFCSWDDHDCWSVYTVQQLTEMQGVLEEAKKIIKNNCKCDGLSNCSNCMPTQK